MTRQEAIDILDEIETIDDSMVAYNEVYAEALDMAVNALKAQETSLEKVADDYGLTVDGVSFALEQYGKVIYDITNGMLSKLGYCAEDILRLANDVQCEGCELKERSEVNPNCHGLGYEECETYEVVCPYR